MNQPSTIEQGTKGLISPGQKAALIAFNALYIAGFGVYYVVSRNFEFLLYVAVVILFFVILLATITRSKFPPYVLWGLSLWGLFHMAGGGIRIGDQVLYGQVLLPILGEGESTILKYDQAVHAFGFMVATFVMFHLLKPQLAPAPNWKVVYFAVAVAGMGLGALNEVVEFIPVAMGFQTGVGGYFNNALDLVFNSIGAITAVILIQLAGRQRAA